MKVLFDANVLLDVLLAREPHLDTARKLVALVDAQRIEGYVCATAVTTLYYIGAKTLGRNDVRASLRTLLGMFRVAPVDGEVLRHALDATDFSDYEDAVVHGAAHAAGCVAVVTRDEDGFANATMAVFQPPALLAAVVAGSA